MPAEATPVTRVRVKVADIKSGARPSLQIAVRVASGNLEPVGTVEVRLRHVETKRTRIRTYAYDGNERTKLVVKGPHLKTRGKWRVRVRFAGENVRNASYVTHLRVRSAKRG